MQELADLISSCRAGERGAHAREIAELRNGALILSDMFSVYALAVNGELSVGDYSATEPVWRSITDPKERSIVLTVAARHLPFLSLLLPDRPAEARNCSTCQGSGFWDVEDVHGKPFSFPCQECGALGWLVLPEHTSRDAGA